MLVLISVENELKNEIATLHQLFKAGVGYFHLRKPGKTIAEYRTYLNRIAAVFHARIVVHEYHELAAEYKLKGVHLQERARVDLQDDLAAYVKSYQEEGYTVSSSFHEPEVLENCTVNFDYHLLSPVFTAISKQNYQGRTFDVTQSTKKIVGMGGINEATLPFAIALGYKGIGVLGGVWNTEKPIESFKIINEKYKLIRSS